MLSTPPYKWLFYDPGHEMKDLLLSFHDIAVNFTVLSILPFQVPSHARSPVPPTGVSRLQHAVLADAVSLLTSAYRHVMNNSDVTHTAKRFREEVNRIIRQVGVDKNWSRKIIRTSPLNELSFLGFLYTQKAGSLTEKDRKRKNGKIQSCRSIITP